MQTYQKTELNITKESIYQALTALMENHDFSTISITDICKKAGVSRMAYYRHYASKEVIFDDHLERMFEAYKTNVIQEKNNMLNATTLFFKFFRRHQVLLKNLQKANLSLLLLSKFTQYIAFLLPHLDELTIENTDILSTQIVFIAGGMFELLMKWSSSNMTISDSIMGERSKILIERVLFKEALLK